MANEYIRVNLFNNEKVKRGDMIAGTSKLTIAEPGNIGSTISNMHIIGCRVYRKVKKEKKK